MLDPADYHQQTKHGLNGYAKGPESIDWDAQPDAFRTYSDAPIIDFPLELSLSGPLFKDFFKRQTIIPEGLSVATLSELLRHSLGVSAWKQLGDAKWALRCNPSSGNLHPTEAYVLAMGWPELADGLYHYRPDLHSLEKRCEFPELNNFSDTSTLIIGLSSIPWRELWKYGERGFRYCQHDLGHGMAALDFAAANLGWQVQQLQGITATEKNKLLGLDRSQEFHFDADEIEVAEVLLKLDFDGSDFNQQNWLDASLAGLESGTWFGSANRLDAYHFYRWPLVGEMYEAMTEERPQVEAAVDPEIQTSIPPAQAPDSEVSFITIAQQRRSGQAYDGSTELPLSVFYQMLDHLIPRADLVPWSIIPWLPRLHLVLFIHRVEGLAPGLYILTRNDAAEQQLKSQMRNEFAWQAVADCPDHIPLKNLIKARSSRTIAKLSCLQPIAGDAAFSLGMLAEFDQHLSVSPTRYAELFWEAGVIGQCLYLDAEVAGFRGTGIGCYFDDAVHDLLGLSDTSFQSLYHFAVGKALVDARVTTLPAYSR